MNDVKLLLDKLCNGKSLSVDEYEALVKGFSPESAAYARELADKVRRQMYGTEVYVRGLIEISNICRNNCYYCGIRGANTFCDRYRLTPEEIKECCGYGYKLGFRSFVLQGGEDAYYEDELLCKLIGDIKVLCPDSAVTLSLGERTEESYKRLFQAGADRYLLRHEAASRELYAKLHPENMSYDNRFKCLENLKKAGYQTGCGFMVGAPFQTMRHIAEDLKFIEQFKPEMCGIGPFVPHKDTCFKDEKHGSAELTCYLLSVIRLINPRVLLPATTALGTVSEDGREKGILAGANVVMPNLSPLSVRKKYDLYDNKLSTGAEDGAEIEELKEKIASVGFKAIMSRGDVKGW